MQLINIIIPTYNRPKQLSSLLNELYSKNRTDIFRVFVIDDNSREDYSEVIQKYTIYKNFQYFKKNRNEGKNAALYDVFSKLKSDDCILVIDDKDHFAFSLSEIKTKSIEYNEVIGFDLYNESGDIIGGSKLNNNTKVYDFYFSCKNTGDKLWIFKRDQIDIDEMKNFFVDGELAYEDSFWTHYIWSASIKESISNKSICRVYLESGITKNILAMQNANPRIYLRVLIIYFENIKNIILKLWYYSLIKKQLKIARKTTGHTQKFNRFTYQFLYLLLWIPIKIFICMHASK